MLTGFAIAVIVAAALYAVRGWPPRAPEPRHAHDRRARARVRWALLAIHVFAWVSGIGLMFAALFFFRAPGRYAWIAGLVTGAALLLLAELRLACNYRRTADAVDGAALGILYATFYAMHARDGLGLPLTIAGVAVVTAVAIFISLNRDSLFVALLALIGGFAAPALLSFHRDPWELFSYLLLLDVALAWIAGKKRWLLLVALSVVFTAVYEWAWVLRFLTSSRLPLAAVIFAVFAVVLTSPLWYGATEKRFDGFRRSAAAAAVLPLLFALYMAASPNYGARFHVLFAFLLFVAAGLVAIVGRGGPDWLYTAGGIATLLTYVLWFRFSYTHDSWPWSLLWLALFMALYRAGSTLFSALLFGVFVGLALQEPRQYAPMLTVMIVLLAWVVSGLLRRGKPLHAATAAALSMLAVLALNPPALLWPLLRDHARSPALPLLALLVAYALVFAALFVTARRSGRRWLAIAAIPFYLLMLTTAYSLAPSYAPAAALAMEILFAVTPYALFLAYAFVVASEAGSPAPYIAVSLASLILFLAAWMSLGQLAGDVAIAEAIVLLLLTWRVRVADSEEGRFTLLGSIALALLNAGIALLLPTAWIAVLFAAEAVALAWLHRRIWHRLLLVWSAGLAALVLLTLALSAPLFGLSLGNLAVYVVCALTMFAGGYLIRRDVTWLQRFFCVAGLFELWFGVNIEIANYFHSSGGALNVDFLDARPAEDVAFTIAWALIATALLITGFLIHSPAARGAALALLIATILKCFLHDVWHLDDDYRSASLFVLASSLVLVAVALQKFIVMGSELHFSLSARAVESTRCAESEK
jgi:predicted membrane protein DUF2339